MTSAEIVQKSKEMLLELTRIMEENDRRRKEQFARMRQSTAAALGNSTYEGDD